jgi:hypothetical protein
MLWLTEDANLICAHQTGAVTGFSPSQSYVTVSNRRVLIAPDTVGRTIAACNMVPPLGKPCTKTLSVITGYSGLIRINGQAVCMDNLTGTVDAPAPPYTVRLPGQQLVVTNT